VPTHVLLGRAAGIGDEQLAHLGDDPLPEGLFTDEAAAIIRYSQASTRMLTIDDDLYGALAAHFEPPQIVELCFVVGFSNLVNRFHATFHTTLDDSTVAALGDSCPLPLPDPESSAPR
jgi:alkylhydroperoxidase family enzyme